nr:phage antirepressor KilAC domain-containing protein [Methylobacterium sp. BTF04]
MPEIRKTRSFGVAPVDPLNLLQDPTILRQLLGDFAEQTMRLQEENRALGIDLTCATAVIENQEPIVEAYAEIVETGEAVCITDAAKLIGVPPSALFEHMRDQAGDEPWIYCRTGRPEVAFQTRINRDELDQKAVPYKRPDGSVGIRSMVVVLPRGLFILRAEMQQRERDRRRAAGEFDL